MVVVVRDLESRRVRGRARVYGNASSSQPQETSSQMRVTLKIYFVVNL
jgi:hypothetical protein